MIPCCSIYASQNHSTSWSNLSLSEASMTPISLTNSVYCRCLMAAILSSKSELCATLISTETARAEYTLAHSHTYTHTQLVGTHTELKECTAHRHTTRSQPTNSPMALGSFRSRLRVLSPELFGKKGTKNYSTHTWNEEMIQLFLRATVA